MKKVTIILTGVILMTIASVSVKAQSSASATSQSSATIISLIELTNDTPLNFGTLVPTNAAGDVTITATNTRPDVTNVKFIGQENSFSAAVFTASGQAGYTFSMLLPGDNLELTSTTVSTDKMGLKTFTSTIDAAANSFPAEGEVVFGVGATLEVAANQAHGLYTGSFPITIAYE